MTNKPQRTSAGRLAEHHLKNYGDLGGCYPPRPIGSVVVYPPLFGFRKGRRNYELVAYEKDRKESFDCIYTTRDYKKKYAYDNFT